MKENKYFLNTALAIVLGLILLIAVLVRTFAPAVIIPQLDIPNLVLISLIPLVLDHYAAKNAKRCYICIPVFSAVTFGLLPFAACFVGGMEDAAATSANVPNFAGMTVSQANSAASAAGVNVEFSGNIKGAGTKAYKQSVAAGTSVDLGTVITVYFRDDDTGDFAR